MPNLTIKNLPRKVHEGLKRRAASNRRSLNQEVVEILSREAGRVPLDPRAFLRDLHALHRRLRIPPVSDEALAKNREGLL